MSRWLYKWLPVIFGCHCLDSRSFHYKGKKFPLCSRCTGELIGIVFGVILWFTVKLPLLLYIIILIPLVIDGMVQMFTKYESNNIKRVVTGFLFGYGLISLFIISNVFVLNLGLSMGKST